MRGFGKVVNYTEVRETGSGEPYHAVRADHLDWVKKLLGEYAALEVPQDHKDMPPSADRAWTGVSLALLELSAEDRAKLDAQELGTLDKVVESDIGPVLAFTGNPAGGSAEIIMVAGPTIPAVKKAYQEINAMGHETGSPVFLKDGSGDGLPWGLVVGGGLVVGAAALIFMNRR